MKTLCSASFVAILLFAGIVLEVVEFGLWTRVIERACLRHV